MLAIGLLYVAFIMFRYVYYVHCTPVFSKTLIMKGCWLLSIASSVSNEIILFYFLSVYSYGGLH